jgi:anti-sigma factor RsiW
MELGDRGQAVVAEDGFDHVAEEIASYHQVYARETDHLVEVPASHKAELEAWLGARLKRPLHVPDLTAEGLSFAGGRLLVVDDNPVAQLIYLRPGVAPSALCITFGEAEKQSLHVVEHKGMHLAIWQADSYAYVFVGSFSEEETRALGEKLAKEVTNT